MSDIVASVGRRGSNRKPDVKTIQDALNAINSTTPGYKRLEPDSLIGPKTIGAILEFQIRVVKLRNPDGRVDPGGKTLKALNADAKGPPPPAPLAPGGGDAIAPGGTVDAPPNLSGWYVATAGGTKNIGYKDTVALNRRLVSDYSNLVIAEALSRAGMPGAIVTSTMRTAREQAVTMHYYCGQTYKKTKSLAGQYSNYKSAGDKVIDVFRDNHLTKTSAEVVSLMEAKINALQKTSNRVSGHIRTVSGYKTRNIIDIGIGSCERAFGASNVKVDALCRAFRALEVEGYIAKFVDETRKTNKCWHIEIIPNAKPIAL